MRTRKIILSSMLSESFWVCVPQPFRWEVARHYMLRHAARALDSWFMLSSLHFPFPARIDIETHNRLESFQYQFWAGVSRSFSGWFRSNTNFQKTWCFSLLLDTFLHHFQPSTSWPLQRFRLYGFNEKVPRLLASAWQRTFQWKQRPLEGSLASSEWRDLKGNGNASHTHRACGPTMAYPAMSQWVDDGDTM